MPRGKWNALKWPVHDRSWPQWWYFALPAHLRAEDTERSRRKRHARKYNRRDAGKIFVLVVCRISSWHEMPNRQTLCQQMILSSAAHIHASWSGLVTHWRRSSEKKIPTGGDYSTILRRRHRRDSLAHWYRKHARPGCVPMNCHRHSSPLWNTK